MNHLFTLAALDIANERGSTIVFPLPIELMQAFTGSAQRG